MKPLILPWQGRDVPHVILEINRECNISCASCYTRSRFRKTREQVSAELETALSLRNLHTITISGGEPTLHPELPQIIGDIHDRGLCTVLLTNGVALDDPLMQKLRNAGLDAVLFHVDMGQTRPDLPPQPSVSDVTRLRQSLVRRAAEHDIQAGLVATLYRDHVGDLNELMRFIHESEHAHFLLITTSWDSDSLGSVTGSLEDGFRTVAPAAARKIDELLIRELSGELNKMGMRPFGRVGASHAPEESRWLCYTSAAVARGTAGRRQLSLASAMSDRFLVKLVRKITGRYMYHVRQNSVRFRLQLLLNAFSGGRLWGNLGILAASCLPGSILREKRIVLQQGPSIASDGTVVHCNHCPDATIVDGRLVPVCFADAVRGATAP